MKRIQLLGLAAIATAFIVALLILARSQRFRPAPVTGGSRTARPAAPGRRDPVAAPAEQRTLAAESTRRPVLENDVPEAGSGPGAVVRVRAGRVLATVNGVEITLKDLVPLPPDKAGDEHSMTPDMYAFLVDRAVQRELVFQAARSAGVALSPSQQLALQSWRERSESAEPGVFDRVQQNAANSQFEQRDFAGLVLQDALVARAGIPSVHVTPEQVERFYQDHKGDFAGLPEDPAGRDTAWQQIDQAIRERLAPQLRAAHEQGVRRYLDQLKSGAVVTVAAVE